MSDSRFDRDTLLASIPVAHWEVVLDEVFHIPPTWVSGKPLPKTVGEVLDRSGWDEKKARQRLGRIIDLAETLEITCEQLAADLKAGVPYLLVDVRQPEEYAICKLSGSILLCDADHAALTKRLAAGEKAVMICHHGIRSFSAAMYFRERGYDQVLSLAGGLDRWATQIDTTMERY